MTEPTSPDLPDRLEAVLTERFTELGNPFARMRIAFQGPDGWPAAKEVGPHDVAEVLRELLASSAGVVQLPPTNQAAVREQVVNALYDVRRPGLGGLTEAEAVGRMAAAVLAVLPTPVDRAAVLREAADAVFALDYDVMVGEEGEENLGSMREAWDLGTIDADSLLRRMAAEAPATEEQDADEEPQS